MNLYPYIKRTSTKLQFPTTANTMYCVISIAKGHENDIGILQHELTHVKQWWRMVLLFAVFSAVAWHFNVGALSIPLMMLGGVAHNNLTRIRWYRKYAEVEAYRAHVKAGRDFENAA